MPHRAERLEMRINEEKVGLLNVLQRGQNIRLIRRLAGAHDVLDTTIKEVRRHDKLVALTIVSEQRENATPRHV